MIFFWLTWPKAEYLPDIERRTWRELDYPGSVLLITAAILIVFPFQNASSGALWDKAIFLAPLLIGVVCWIALVIWEIFVERYWGDKLAAAFPIRLLRNRVYSSAVVNTLFLGFPFIMLVYAFPLRLQIVNGKTSLLAGVMMLPLLAASATGSILAGVVNGKKDRTCETMILSSSLVALGCGLLSTLSDPLELETKAFGFLVFVGLGFGLSAAGTTMTGNMQSSLRDHCKFYIAMHHGYAKSRTTVDIVFSTRTRNPCPDPDTGWESGHRGIVRRPGSHPQITTCWGG